MDSLKDDGTDDRSTISLNLAVVHGRRARPGAK